MAEAGTIFQSIYTGSQIDQYLGMAALSVPSTRKVNNKALNADVTLSASDVGAWSSTEIPYETGSWTPTIYGATTAGSPAYNANTQGSYTRIGNLAFLKYTLWITSKGGMSGALSIGGVPFTQTVGNNAAASGYVSGVTSTYANYNVCVQTGANSLPIILNNAVNNSQLTDTMIGDSFMLFGQVIMIV